MFNKMITVLRFCPSFYYYSVLTESPKIVSERASLMNLRYFGVWWPQRGLLELVLTLAKRLLNGNANQQSMTAATEEQSCTET